MQIPSEDPAIKKSVSMPRSLLNKAIERGKSLGYNLSQYIQHLIRNDIQRGGDEIPRIAEKPGTYGNSKGDTPRV